MSLTDNPPDLLYVLKREFLDDMKSRIAHHYDELISSPQPISSETRARWREEADRANEMFDLIYEDIARLEGLEY